MAQIIKHKRGSLEKLSSVTGSLQKGELVIATGSVKLGNVTNGQALVFAAYESGAVSATNRILRGDVAPIFSASTYNGMLDGVPFYASASNTLFLLGSDENEAIDLSGNISDFSSSVSASISNLSSSIQSVTGDFSSSVATSFSASAFNLNELSASVASDLNSLSGSLTSSIGETQTSITNLSSSVSNISGAFATSTSASNTAITSLSASVASVTGDFSSSVATSFSASNASIASLSASVASVTGDFSSSVATSFSASTFTVSELSKSIALTDNAQSDRLNTLESSTGSYALLSGSNIFYGNQVITGSVFVSANLIVQGSSSLQNITASAVSIGTNTIILNTDTPAVRYAGISVFDSGSTNVTASLFYDGLTNNWKFEHNDTGTNDASIVLFGPLGTGIDNAPTLTGNFVTKVENNGHGHHLTTSSIEDTGTKVTIYNPLDVTGAISSSTIVGIGNVTLYSQSVDSRVASLESSVGAGGAIGTRVSNLETISSSYLAFTQSYYSDSSSFDTRISASKAEYTSFSASAASGLSSVSGAFATSTSASNYQITELSASVASVGGTFSSSVATDFSASKFEYTLFSASAASDLNSVSGAFATSTSASKAEYTLFSASAASNLSSVSGAFATSISASDARELALSTSVDSRLDTLEASLGGGGEIGTRVANLETISASYLSFTQSYYSDSASFDTRISDVVGDLDTISGSVYTQFSASNASQLALSTSVDSRLDAEEFKSTTFATTGSNSFTGSQGILGDVTVSGSVYIQFGQDLVTNHISGNQGAIELGNTDNNINIIAQNELRLTATGSGVHVHSAPFSVSPDGINNNVLVVSASITTVTNEFSASNISGVGNIGAFSQSVDSRFSASAYTVSQLSASVASVTGDFSSSVATSISASNANEAAWSASIASRTTRLEASQSAFDTAFELTGSSVTILGDLRVIGTQSVVNSTTIDLGDNILSLNGTGGAFGGLIVKDPTAPSTFSGSLLWDTTNDYWIAGKSGSEAKVLLAIGDNVVSSSEQITLSSTTGFTSFDTAISTSFSASAYNVSSLSASVASVTGDFSSSVATSFSASAFTVSQLSSSVVTSFSASAASLTALSASIYLTDVTQSTDITNNSSSFATSISASNFRITTLETTIDGGSY